jgi:hypothetical protein
VRSHLRLKCGATYRQLVVWYVDIIRPAGRPGGSVYVFKLCKSSSASAKSSGRSMKAKYRLEEKRLRTSHVRELD